MDKLFILEKDMPFMDLASTIKRIRQAKSRRVLIQIPEGLKTRVLDIASELERHGIEALISCDPCYGACDLKDMEAKALGCDALVHIGHSGLVLKPALPVIYDEYRMDFDPLPLLGRHMQKLEPYKRLGLATSLQFLGLLDPAARFLQSAGKTVLIGKPKRAAYPGQVLGCDFSAAKSIEKGVDCFLFIGSGRFHPLGLALAVEKPVLFLDLEGGSMESMEEDRQGMEKIRFARVEKAKDCKNFGILVSTKRGQINLRQAEKVKKQLEATGKKAWILVFDEITPEKIMGMKLDCLVNCACPRIFEDSQRFKKPIIDCQDACRL
jgi:2-(3-amino-3-carboxypropyl)histidine synthase